MTNNTENAGGLPEPASVPTGGPPNPASVDERTLGAWREWLGALATNPEAAMAAALAYEQLDEPARDSWIEALAGDADQARVPRFAVYAPLLAVEADAERRRRISAAIGQESASLPAAKAPRSCIARRSDGLVLCVLVRPLYLDFVQVLACAYRINVGFEWVKHDPIMSSGSAPQPGDQLSGMELEKAPFQPLIDELAHTVVAHRRSGRPLPDALRIAADLFSPDSSAVHGGTGGGTVHGADRG